MKPIARELAAEGIESLDALDAVAEPVQGAVRTVLPRESQAKDLLSGTWLGHPLHPPLTDVVVGAWTSALLLDVVGGRDGEKAAEYLVGAGVLAAVPTAAAGLSDWADLRGASRRVGMVHAAGNTVALALQACSWAVRRSGKRTPGVALSAAAVAVAGASAWLGGHLSFGRGVGVDQTAFESAPDEWTTVLDESEVEEGRLVAVQADGVDILLVRHGDALHALADRCSHRGCSLHAGRLDGDTVVCACHGSTFRLDGSLVKGPATAPQPSFAVRAHDGKIEIRA